MALQQQYALEQMSKQSELSYANWQKQFDYENDYNDPSKVFDRYRTAGVNPAAVLGSSGVGVNATMSGGSAGIPSASGPTGGSPIAPGGFNVDPTAIAQNEMVQSTVDRNKAAANRDQAEAMRTRGETHTEEFRKRMDDLQLSIQEHHVTDQKALASLHSAQAQIFAIDAAIADITQGYNMQAVIAQTSILKEQYEMIRQQNNWFAPQAGAALAAAYASIIANRALAVESQSRTDLNTQQYLDLQKWYELNWEKDIEITIYDDKGNPTGEKKKMKVAETMAVLQGFAAETAQLEQGTTRWDLRNSKNKLGYDILRTVTGGLGMAAAAYAGGKGSASGKAARAGSGSYDSTREVVNADGEIVGGWHETKRYMKY
ncbi:DNA pilot protein [Tortoise microvirus 7]|nr:DNA pilot protein [Tortoise microvirus 7]QCS37459.1 DNA pilot protein [Tortoise microvirus 105]